MKIYALLLCVVPLAHLSTCEVHHHHHGSHGNHAPRHGGAQGPGHHPPHASPVALFACFDEAEKFCAKEISGFDVEGAAPLLACLYGSKDLLSTSCSRALTPLPEFQCAQDALRLCPAISKEPELHQCLEQNFEQVSNDCRDAVRASHMPPRPPRSDKGQGLQHHERHHRHHHGGPPPPPPDFRQCRHEAQTLCKAELLSMEPVALAGCLHAHQAELSATCLDSVQSSAIFQCAEDAKRLCGSETDDFHRLVGCMSRKIDQASQSCQDAAQRDYEARQMDERDGDDEEDRRHHHHHSALPLILGVGLAVLVVAAVVRARRRARRRRAEQSTQEPHHAQLTVVQGVLQPSAPVQAAEVQPGASQALYPSLPPASAQPTSFTYTRLEEQA